MNASIQIKGILAGIAAVAVMGTAIAQSAPPNRAVVNPAIGAGQQSTQGTPMGMTGTPGGSNMATTTPAPAATAAAPVRAAPMASSDTSSSTKMASNKRRTRADRN